MGAAYLLRPEKTRQFIDQKLWHDPGQPQDHQLFDFCLPKKERKTDMVPLLVSGVGLSIPLKFQQHEGAVLIQTAMKYALIKTSSWVIDPREVSKGN